MRRVVLLLCVLSLSPSAGWAKDAGSNDDSSAGWCARFKQCCVACRDYLAAIPDNTRACLRRWAVRSDQGRELPVHLRAGLVLPKKLDSKKPLVILIHGLDSGPAYWCDLAPLLETAGHRLARFNYPNDQALEESASLLGNELAGLKRKHPGLKFDLVAHSMGALIARAFVEGDHYHGGVRRLIMLAPPNRGSCYARFSQPAELIEHVQLWCSEPEWSWTWLVSDGLGEARRDLAPGSAFLEGINSRPRRAGVRYTIVAGNRTCGWRYTANVMRFATGWLPNVRYSRTARETVAGWAVKLESRTGSSDGLVSLASTRLPGIDDFVVVPADHTTLTCSRGGNPPVAWRVIAERLK